MQLSKISEHAKERYAERIKDRDGYCEVKQYVATHKEQIDTDLHKMAEHAAEVYRGPGKDSKVIVMLVQGSWILICGEDGTLVTLFKRELGVNDEKENRRILNLQIEELQRLVKLRDDADHDVQERRDQISSDISDWEVQEAAHRAQAKEIRALIDALADERKTVSVIYSEAEARVQKFINDVLMKPIFGL